MDDKEKIYTAYYDKGGQYIPAEEIPKSLLSREFLQSINLLGTLEGDLLEAQLKTFDLLFPTLSQAEKLQMISLLGELAIHVTTIKTRLRLRKAFISLNAGEAICKP